MGNLSGFPAVAAVALLLAVPDRAADQATLMPSRDVDITYDATRPQQPKTRQRVRWLAGEHLERVDGSGRATTFSIAMRMR